MTCRWKMKSGSRHCQMIVFVSHAVLVKEEMIVLLYDSLNCYDYKCHDSRRSERISNWVYYVVVQSNM